jgi:hypothetical protein
MPYDLKGNLLQVGDIVSIPCKVKLVTIREEYCNVELETTQVMYPGENRSTFILNSRQVEKK